MYCSTECFVLESKTRQSDQNSAYFPSSVAELERISKYVVDEPDFVEVVTKSVLYADAKGAYPVFVVPGFRPNVLQGLYSNLGYPTFEARYPSKFESIYSVASLLVKVRQGFQALTGHLKTT